MLCAERWKARTSGLPPAVLMAYFLITWSESFPMTAMTSLLNFDIGMPVAEQTNYYAVTFLPFMWKPLYGWMSDNYPILGYRRIPYMMIGGAGACVVQVVIAVWATSVASLYALTLCQSMFTALVQLMVGTFLVDVARRDVSNAVALQSLANATQWVGTLVATIMARFMYTTGSGGIAAESILGTRGAIGLTAAAPAAIVLLAAFMPEPREATLGSGPASHTRRRGLAPSDSKRIASAVAIVQANLMLIGCQYLMDSQAWLHAVLATAVVSSALLIGIFIASSLCRSTGAHTARELALEEQVSPLQAWQWAALCIFCFAVNAIPSASVPLSSYQIRVLSSHTYQNLSIIGAIASLVASVVFGGGFYRCGTMAMFVTATLVATVAALSPLPFAQMAIDTGAVGVELISPLGLLCVAGSVISSFGSIFSVLPVDILVTSASGGISVSRGSTAYGVLLSFYSFGGTAGGLLSTRIQTEIGLDATHFEPLPGWIVWAACLKLLTLPMLLLLCFLPTRGAGTSPATTGTTCSMASGPGDGISRPLVV